MKKISNKGFVLAETIIVAVFMVTIFTVLYSNYYPIMANFEKREYYDDVDSKYIAFWLKYMIQDSSFKTSGLPTGNSIAFSCSNIENVTKRNTCISLVRESGLSTNPYCKDGGSSCTITGNLNYIAYIVKINGSSGISGFKNDVNNTASGALGYYLSDGFIDYINYLPDYKNKTGYRLVLEIYDNKVTGRKPIYKYASIGVNR